MKVIPVDPTTVQFDVRGWSRLSELHDKAWGIELATLADQTQRFRINLWGKPLHTAWLRPWTPRVFYLNTCFPEVKWSNEESRRHFRVFWARHVPRAVMTGIKLIRNTLDPECVRVACAITLDNQLDVYSVLTSLPQRERQWAISNLTYCPALYFAHGDFFSTITPDKVLRTDPRTAKQIVRRLRGLPRLGAHLATLRPMTRLGQVLLHVNIDRWDRWTPMDRYVVAWLLHEMPALASALAPTLQRQQSPYRFFRGTENRKLGPLLANLRNLRDYLQNHPAEAGAPIAELWDRQARWHRDLYHGRYANSPVATVGPFVAPSLREFTVRLGAKTATATWLSDAQALHDEGIDMHHCVGGYGYASACARGRYAIYRVEGDIRGTLTLTNTGMVDQFLGSCNSGIPDASAWASEIVRLLHHQNFHLESTTPEQVEDEVDALLPF